SGTSVARFSGTHTHMFDQAMTPPNGLPFPHREELMKIVRNVAAVVSLAVLAGCELGLTDFEPIDFDAFSLSLWQENTSGVYFLPPLMHSSYSGEFDAG